MSFFHPPCVQQPRIIIGKLTLVQLALVLATLGATVLKPDLDARLAETESLAQLLAHERVRVVGLVEQPLQLGELLQREIRPRAALLPVATAAAATAAAAATVAVRADAGGPSVTSAAASDAGRACESSRIRCWFFGVRGMLGGMGRFV